METSSRQYESVGETTNNPSSTGGLTLGGILSIKQTPPYRIHDRTLLDLIRDDQTNAKDSSKNTWKIFKDKLRLKLVGPTLTTSVPSNTNSIIQETHTENIVSIQPAEIPEEETVENNGGGGTAVRMSLMSLLEVEGAAYMNNDEVEDEVEEVVVVEGSDGGGDNINKYNNCCVCMVRHKGAAFIPCGHTFCRLCSRELFVKRASCPLCNNFILEILDIF